MKTSASSSLLLLPALLLLLSPVYAGKGSGESGECQQRRNTCDGLVHEPPSPPPPPSPPAPPSVPTPAPGQCVCTPAPPSPGSPAPPGSGEGGNFNSHCELVEAFYNFSIYLTVSQQVEWEAWIVEIENTILVNVSLTDDQKVSLISLSLQAFFSVHIDIYNELSFLQIGSWGAVIDFLYIHIQIQLEITQSVVTLDGSNSCELFQCLENGSANASPSEQQAIQALVVELQLVLEDSSYTYTQQLAQCWVLFQAFFVQNPSMESWVLSLEINGYGSIQAFLDVCQTYERIVTLSTVISGNSTSNCVLLGALQAATQNSSFNFSVQAQINQLLMVLEAYFQTTVDISLRLEYISTECFQFFLQEPWMVSVIEQISLAAWGDIYDIVFCSSICTNYGCGNPNQGPGPQGGSTTASPAPTSTAAASTAAAATAAPTVQPANCATVGSLITVNVTTNATVLTDTLTVAYNSWTPGQRTGFNSVFNKIRQGCYNNTAFSNQQQRLEYCQAALWSYNNNSVSAQQLVFNLTINVWVGTIAQFVACIN